MDAKARRFVAVEVREASDLPRTIYSRFLEFISIDSDDYVVAQILLQDLPTTLGKWGNLLEAYRELR